MAYFQNSFEDRRPVYYDNRNQYQDYGRPSQRQSQCRSRSRSPRRNRSRSPCPRRSRSPRRNRSRSPRRTSGPIQNQNHYNKEKQRLEEDLLLAKKRVEVAEKNIQLEAELELAEKKVELSTKTVQLEAELELAESFGIYPGITNVENKKQGQGLVISVERVQRSGRLRIKVKFNSGITVDLYTIFSVIDKDGTHREVNLKGHTNKYK